MLGGGFLLLLGTGIAPADGLTQNPSRAARNGSQPRRFSSQSPPPGQRYFSGASSLNPDSAETPDSVHTTTVYYLFNFCEIGFGGGDNDASFLELDLFKGAVGQDIFKGALGQEFPLLIGLTLIRLRYMPLGDKHNILRGIVSGLVVNLTYRPTPWFAVFTEGNKWGRLCRSEIYMAWPFPLPPRFKGRMNTYNYKYVDVGIAFSKRNTPMNRLTLKAVSRFASTNVPAGGPISGLYLSFEVEFGWVGQIAR